MQESLGLWMDDTNTHRQAYNLICRMAEKVGTDVPKLMLQLDAMLEEITFELSEEEKAASLDGSVAGRLNAIKSYYRRTGVSLTTAKDTVDKYKKENTIPPVFVSLANLQTPIQKLPKTKLLDSEIEYFNNDRIKAIREFRIRTGASLDEAIKEFNDFERNLEFSSTEINQMKLGNKIDAIRYYRSRKQTSIKDAKDKIESVFETYCPRKQS